MVLSENIPEDVKEYIGQLTEDAILKNKRITQLEEIILEYKRQLFGRKSEKLDPNDVLQSRLFNEAELGLYDPPELYDGHSETIDVKSFIRKKSGRKPLPDNLPREVVPHDIDASEKICNCGHELTRIGEDISEKISIIPQQVYVEKHIRFKYACKNCEGDERNEAGKIVITAPNLSELIPRSIVTPEILSYVITSKLVDHIPYFRLVKIFLRYGLEITRSTLSNWTISVYERYKSLFTFWDDLLLSGSLLGIDETRVQVHREEGRLDTQTSYIWAFRGGTVNRPIIKYDYRTGRSADFLKVMLRSYTGTIQTDGFTSYDAHFRNNPNIRHAGCHAHSRREFEKVWKASKDSVAGEALNFYRKAYRVEREIRDAELYKRGMFKEIVEIRQAKAKPIMDEFYTFLQIKFAMLPKSIGVGKAIAYTLGQWEKLTLYLSHGEVYIDNNLVENIIRPFVIGRKNWLFFGSPHGAEASSFWYSLELTAIANQKDPYKFTLEFLKGLPFCKTSEDAKILFFKCMGWV